MRTRPPYLLCLLLLLLTATGWCQGKVYATWEPATSPANRAARSMVESDQFHRVLPQVLNKLLRFPRDLPIVYKETGKVNAWYSPQQHQITVSYELVSALSNSFPPQQGIGRLGKIRGTLNFILLHEVGHALVGELGLPVVAREEDAADEFATIFCTLLPQDQGVEMARAAAEWFGKNGEALKPVKNLPYWDEHSLNAQRHFDILSDLYGSNPGSMAFLKSRVPAARLKTAENRFPQKLRTWNRLLAAHETSPSNSRLLTKPVPLPGVGGVRFEQPATNGQLLPPDKLWRVGAYQRLIPKLNNSFKLDRVITVRVAPTGSNRHINNLMLGRITLSEEASQETDRMLRKLQLPEKKRLQLLRSFEDFALLKQFCRTLIFEYDLPITGPIDDAAEDLAALLAVGDPTLRPILFDIAFFYEAQGVMRNGMVDKGYWQAPALELQKFFEVLSYLYVEDPKTYPYYPTLVPEKLRQRQIQRSRQDYLKKRRAWQMLLKPYLKTS